MTAVPPIRDAAQIPERLGLAILKGTPAGTVTIKAQLGVSTATGTLTISPTALLESLVVIPHTVSAAANPHVDLILTVSGLAAGQTISVAILPQLDEIVITEPDTTGTLSGVSVSAAWAAVGVVTFSAKYNDQTVTAELIVTP